MGSFEVPRFYPVDGAGMLVSVTTFLKVINKPQILGWTVKIEREAAAEVLLDMLTSPPKGLDRDAFFKEFEIRLKEAKAAQAKKEEARDIGAAVHEAIEGWLYGKVPTLSGPAEIAFDAYLDWEKRAEVTHAKPEVKLHSLKYRYAGRTDLLALVKGVPTVFDWKVSKRPKEPFMVAGKPLWVYPEQPMQAISYLRAAQEMGMDVGGKGPPTQAAIVRIPKVEGDVLEVSDVPDDEPTFQAAVSARRLWSHMFPEAEAKAAQKAAKEAR